MTNSDIEKLCKEMDLLKNYLSGLNSILGQNLLGESENAVRIQIHVAIITYCLIGIIEHDMQIGRPIVEVMLILGSSLLTMDDVRDLLEPFKRTEEMHDERQLCFNFQFD